MEDQTTAVGRLRQTNRLLLLGYLVFGVLGVAGYTLAQADPDDPAEDRVFVNVNAGSQEQITAVEHEKGFAVYVDAEGEINVIHRDGTVIVPNRKVFSHVYQENEQNKSYIVDRPAGR